MASSIVDLGPFTHHVYLAFCTYDFPLVDKLRTNLESKGILCLARHDTSQASKSIMSIITNGIAHSRKVVVYLSKEYREEDNSVIEVPLINEKASRFSRDAVIVLKNSKVTQTDCNRMFKSSPFYEMKEEDLCNDQFAIMLSEVILKEPNCILATVPKQNIGYGAAVGYFYGYLRLVLPDFTKRLLEETMVGASKEVIDNTVRKMLIIMPESCFCPPLLMDEGDTRFEFTKKYVLRSAHRAGNVNRDYKSSVYIIHDEERGKAYHFVGELATPLLTMYESYHYRMTGLTKDELYAERDAFYWTLKAVLNHNENQNCNDQFELLVWKSDPKSDVRKDKQVQFYDFLLPEIRRLIEVQKEREKDSKAQKEASQLCAIGVESSEATSEADPTSIIVKHSRSNPAEIYDNIRVGAYPLSQDNRGVCLIICNKSFEKNELTLEQRTGAAYDTELLERVFSDLKFQVQVHEDLTLENLERLLLTTKSIDHTDFSAFVCVFMTHGKLGMLYTADSKAVRILDLVGYFGERHCPSLAGKPKMFFIQACQKGSPEAGSPEAGAQPNGQLESDAQNPVTSTDDCSLEEDAAKELTLVAESENYVRSLLVPSEPDFVMSYATVPGATAYRDPEVGSLYITELGKQLNNRLELDRALTLVTQQVKQRLQHPDYDHLSKKMQVPFHLKTTDHLINL